MNLFQKIAALPDAMSGRLFIDPERNGEYRFARSIIRDGMVVFDVGANVGDYSKYLLGLARQLKIHCFEPVVSTFASLQQTLKISVEEGQVFLNCLALGERSGSAEMFVYHDNAGSNSFYFHDYHATLSKPQMEEVKLTTIDEYIKVNSVGRVALLKIDIEGHEVNAIQGAQESIREGRIACIQFEYNNYWQRSDHTLVEMLELLEGLNSFVFFRLTPWGKWPIGKIKSSLEDFKHSNYVAILKPKHPV